LVISIFVGKKIAVPDERKVPEFQKKIKRVYTQNVQNNSVRVSVSASGNLAAKNKIDLYSEVQGVLKITKKDYREGVKYLKGETILAIDSDEFLANLRAQKSSFLNSLAAIMPDLQLDFPKEFEKWQSYLHDFEINKPTPILPKISSDKEKFFLSGRSILTNYYNLKNLETRFKKYSIKAPYNGVLTKVLVNQGALVRTGQQLGVYMDNTVFELVVNMKESNVDLLKIGNKVTVSNINKTSDWEGEIIRINPMVNSETQTVKVYIAVAGEDLREGMFLNASLQTKEIPAAITIPRILLVDEEKIYIVEEEILKLIKINAVHFTDKEVIIQGLKNGTAILSRIVPGAYDGMQIQTININ
jgi:multidrug efflux pump subunit AcrA (membrane-fusion protein)